MKKYYYDLEEILGLDDVEIKRTEKELEQLIKNIGDGTIIYSRGGSEFIALEVPTDINCSILVYSRELDHTSTENIRTFYLSKTDAEKYKKNFLKQRIYLYEDLIKKATINCETLKKN